MKPGMSVDWVVVLPMEWERARVVWRVEGDVARPGMISTSFMTGTVRMVMVRCACRLQ